MCNIMLTACTDWLDIMTLSRDHHFPARERGKKQFACLLGTQLGQPVWVCVKDRGRVNTEKELALHLIKPPCRLEPNERKKKKN